MSENYMDYVPKVHFEMIPIKNLVSNQDYQRKISMKHIKRTADAFDPYQINPVKVSRRNGVNYVFNGQHTVEIIALASGSRETPVWCMIYDDLNYEQEADIFANQMKFTKALLPYEIFKANLEAGNEEQLMIQSLLESYKLTVSPSSKNGCVSGITVVQKIYRKYGYHVLDRTLKLLVCTWEGEARSLSSAMFSGVAKMIDCYGDSFDDDVFIEKLSFVPCSEIIRMARERQGGAQGYAEALVIQYNKRNKSTLSLGKLYGKKKGQAEHDNPEDIEPLFPDEKQ